MKSELFDEIDWIKNYFEGKINYEFESIESIRNFALLWNMFEAIGCNKEAKNTSIESFVDKINKTILIDKNEFMFFIDFTKHRYVDESGNIKSIFDRLNFKSEIDKKRVHEVLIGTNEDDKEVLKALLFIVLRLRNNLFHGEKNIVTLNIQENCFNTANKFIAKCLDLHKEAMKKNHNKFNINVIECKPPIL